MTPRALRLSRYNTYVSAGDGRVLVHNTLSGACVVLEAREWAAVKDIHRGESALALSPTTDETLDTLIGLRILKPTALDETRLFQSLHNLARFGDRHLTLTLIPTLRCNLRCDYCFQTTHDARSNMHPSVIDAVVAWVRRRVTAAKSVHVAWYGGEPTLAWSVVDNASSALLALTTEHEVSYSALLVTNGTVMSRAILSSIDTLRITQVQVTLDGPPDIHNARRVGVARRPTFNAILRNLGRLHESTKAHISIRINVDNRNADRVSELLTLLTEAGLSDPARVSVYFARVDNCSPATVGVIPHLLSRREYYALEERYLEQAFAQGLAPVRYPHRGGLSNCAAVQRNGCVVLPNGDLHRCWNEVSYPERRLGSFLNHGDGHLWESAWVDWVGWTFRDQCRACKYLPLCIGGCPLKDIRADDYNDEADDHCAYYKYRLRATVRRYWAWKKSAATMDDVTVRCGSASAQEGRNI